MTVTGKVNSHWNTEICVDGRSGMHMMRFFFTFSMMAVLKLFCASLCHVCNVLVQLWEVFFLIVECSFSKYEPSKGLTIY